MKKVIVNNFFSGILNRGIPIYTSELSLKLHEHGCDVIEVTCPKILSRCPRFLLNIIFILCEQIYIPLLGIAVRSSFNIYSYNSSSVIDVVLGKAVPIIHDLISLGRKKSLAALYVSCCIKFSSAFVNRVIFISKSTGRMAFRLKLFTKSDFIYLPNPFFEFELLSQAIPKKNDGYVLLVTGVGTNKDLAGALKLYQKLPEEIRLPLKILGCGTQADFAYKLLKHNCEKMDFEIFGALSLPEVVVAYSSSAFVWAHSLSEGYGRAIAESKLAKKHVICTRIPPFSEQKTETVHYYHISSVSEFIDSFKECFNISFSDESLLTGACFAELKEHIDFNAGIQRLCGE